jgi:probable F420-dependent oxidoreductase
MRPFRFGLVRRPDQPVTTAARRAQDAGYSTLLFPDHTERIAPLPAMAAAAAVTDQLRIGSQVINIAFRPLGALAQEAATVDAVSDGRLELGLGAGYAEQEVRSLGLPFPSNAERIREVARALDVLPRLFAGEAVTEAPGPGRLTDFRLDPPAPQGAGMPLMVGGNGDRMLAVAAQGANIVQFTGFTAPPPGGLTHFDMEGLADRVAYVRRQAGERFATLELSLLVQFASVTNNPEAEAAAAVRDLPVTQALESPFLLLGSVDAICDRLIELRERFGISYFTVFDGRSDGFEQVVARLAGT